MNEEIWFYSFWGTLLGLSLVEALLARNASEMRRHRWPVNLGLGVFNASLFSFAPLGAVWLASWAQTHEWGLFHHLSFPGWCLAIIAFLVLDASAYALHRLFHHIPGLWKIHLIHHSDRELDATSTLRFHPFEVALNQIMTACIVIAMGFDPIIIAVIRIVDSIVAIVSHTSIQLPAIFERTLSLIFVTPGLHHAHHSVSVAESNCNFGTTLSIWDRLFGTLSCSDAYARRTLRYGVEGVGAEQARKFEWLLLRPTRWHA